MSRGLSRVSAAFVAVVVAITANVGAPAWACACGAYIPDTQGPTVVDEKALIRWDSGVEEIVMGLGVEGTSKKAAWIMPVPTRAEVRLAEPGIFAELDELTRPRIEYDDPLWPNSFLPPFPFAGGSGGDSAGAPRAIEVRGQQRIGPFDVTRLGADDATALADWLGEQGFPHPPTLDADLRPYVEEGWETIAIRLAPYLDGTTYLTKFTQVIQLPSSIEQDITFVRSTNNESFRETVVVTRDRLVFVGPATMLLFVLVAVAMVVVSARRRRSRVAAA